MCRWMVSSCCNYESQGKYVMFNIYGLYNGKYIFFSFSDKPIFKNFIKV